MDSRLPVQNRFCVTWSAELIEKRGYSVASNYFSFRNEQYYFKLNYYSAKQQFEIVLFRSDSVDSNNKPNAERSSRKRSFRKRSFRSVGITVLLEHMGFCGENEKPSVEYYTLSDSKTIFTVPNVICNFKLFDEHCVEDYCRELGDQPSYRYAADFLCFLDHLDESPQIENDFLCFLDPFDESPKIQNNLETGESPTVVNSPSDLEGLSLDLGNMLKNETLPDIKLKYGKDYTIPAHRTLLAARSRVFAAMFNGEMAESETSVVDLGDLEQDIVDAFLQYVYTGKFPSDLSDGTVSGLYAAAYKYAVHILMDSCRDRMISRLSKQNCVNYLAQADACSDLGFKETVISFICRNEEILRGETWLEFIKNPSPLAMKVYQAFVERKAKVSTLNIKLN